MKTLSVQKQIEEVVRLKDKEDLTFEAIGNELGFSDRTARRRYALAGAAIAALEEFEESEDFPEVDKLDIKVQSHYVPEDKKDLERFQPLVRYGDAMVT